MSAICSICGSDMTVQDGEGTAFCLSCENAGLHARIAELEAALEETMEALDEALPYVMDNIPEEELVGWRKRHIDYAREVLRRAAATLKGDADAG